MAQLNLTVVDVRIETPLIRSLILESADQRVLPAFTAGSHLKITIPGQTEPRCYSLMCLDEEPSSFDTPAQYRLGVRLEDPSKGGSLFMHGLKVGDSLTAQAPKNDFPLHDEHVNERPIVLIAGGIGITPIASMAASLRRARRPFQLHYYGRSRDQMAYAAALQALHGDSVHLHPDDEASAALPLIALLDQLDQKQHVYVCGPKGLIDLVVAQAHDKQWPHAHVHFELFVTAAPQFGDRAFDVEIKSTGQVLHIPSSQTILQVLEEAGCDPLYDCKRGECGVCQVTVLEGTPDHRDYYLSDAERVAGDVMQICISRSHSDRLVLDL